MPVQTSTGDVYSDEFEFARSTYDPEKQPTDQPPFDANFNTKLDDTQEAAFQTWKQQYAPHDSGADYDLRGAFQMGLTPDPATGHWPDTFKKPNHPTFSDQSQYAIFGNPGSWDGDKFIPAGTKSRSVVDQLTGADGGERYQLWPERATREVLNNIKAFMTSEPGSEENIAASTQVAFDLGLGGMAAAPKGSLGMFGGRIGAARVPESAAKMEQAVKELAKPEGGQRAQTFNDTGVFEGPDAKYRFEIPDNKAALIFDNLEEAKVSGFKYNPKTGNIDDIPHYDVGGRNLPKTVGDILHHPELYAHYPDLKDIPVSNVGPFDYAGMHWSATDKHGERLFIAPGPPEQIYTVLLHELQHAVQDREGFTTGGNLGTFLPKGEDWNNLLKTKRQAEKILQLDWKGLEGTYKKSFGDVSYIIGKAERGLTMKPEEKDFLYQLQSEQPNYVKLMQLHKQSERFVGAHNDAAAGHYRKLYGEVEARMTEARSGMGAEDRITNPPFASKEFMDAYPKAVIDAAYIQKNPMQPTGKVKDKPWEQPTKNFDIPEKIDQIAVRYKHNNHIEADTGVIHAELMNRISDKYHLKRTPYDAFEAGYMTNRGRFVGREEALKIAEAQKQTSGKNHSTMWGELMSEDLPAIGRK